MRSTPGTACRDCEGVIVIERDLRSTTSIRGGSHAWLVSGNPFRMLKGVEDTGDGPCRVD